MRYSTAFFICRVFLDDTKRQFNLSQYCHLVVLCYMFDEKLFL